MKNIQKLPYERHPYGKLRSRRTILPERLAGVVDYPSSCGWHECNDRYSIVRERPEEICTRHLILFTLAGEGLAHTAGQTFRPGPGTVMIFLKDMPHSYRVPAGGSWEFYWLHLSGVNCTALLEHIVGEHGHLFEISCMDKIAECMETLIQTEYRYYQYEILAAKTVSEMLFSMIDGVRTTDREIHRRRELTLEVIRYIEQHYREPLHLNDIGAHLYLSCEHLIRIFREETGMTPYQYLKQYRLRRACACLEETGMHVSEIAREVGYSSPSSFIAQFRDLYGVTPLTYRGLYSNRSLTE